MLYCGAAGVREADVPVRGAAPAPLHQGVAAGRRRLHQAGVPAPARRAILRGVKPTGTAKANP